MWHAWGEERKHTEVTLKNLKERGNWENKSHMGGYCKMDLLNI
jgi:hypothetical protein